MAAAIGRLGEALERNAVGYLRRRLKRKEFQLQCDLDGIFMFLFEDIVIFKNAVDVRNNNITENGFKQFEKLFSHCCEEENNDAVVFISSLQLMCDGNPGFLMSWCKRLLALCAFNGLYEKCRQNRKGEAMRSLGEVGLGASGAR